MKKTFIFLLALTLGVGAAWGKTITSISLNPHPGRILVGDKIQLSVNIAPSDWDEGYWDIQLIGDGASNATVWQESNKWYLKPIVKDSPFRIRIRGYNGEGQTCAQNVYEWTAIQGVDSITISPNPSTLTMEKNEEVTFTVTTWPKDANYPEMTLIVPTGTIEVCNGVELVGKVSYSEERNRILTFTLKALTDCNRAEFELQGDQYKCIRNIQFPIVEEKLPTGIETLYTTSLPVGYYNILGQKLRQEPESGVYIIMYDNGKTKKAVK